MVEESMGVRQAREVSSSQFLSGAWPYPDPRAAMTKAAARTQESADEAGQQLTT